MDDDENYTRDILFEINNEITEESKPTIDKYTKGLATCLAPGPAEHDLSDIKARLETLEKIVAEILQVLKKEV